MKIYFSKSKPPIYERCAEQFGVRWKDKVIFTYGDTIHCKNKVGKQKIAHETTHVNQQLEYGVKAWWERYFIDVDFRIEQEVEAYRNEIDWVRSKIWDMKNRKARIDHIIEDLCSPMYGSVVNYKKAIKLLGLNK